MLAQQQFLLWGQQHQEALMVQPDHHESLQVAEVGPR